MTLWTDLPTDAGSGADKMTREDILKDMRDNLLVACEFPFTLGFGSQSQDSPQNADPATTTSTSFVLLEDWEIWIEPSVGTKLVLGFICWGSGSGETVRVRLNEGTPVDVDLVITDGTPRGNPGPLYEFSFSKAQIDPFRSSYATFELYAKVTTGAVFLDEPNLSMSRFEEE